jgi:tRNA nucleotidyltransferase (CCA-adding enzyme)
MNRIKIDIPEAPKVVMDVLQNNGYKAYIVGGACRDAILGKSPKDWDICTNARTDQMKHIFREFNTIDTGIEHGTITVMVDKEPIEVTTFRVDGEYTNGRQPDSVEFTNNIVDDLARRDLTINSLAYNDKEWLIDPFGGLSDLKNKVIRCVGNPLDRFEEDALRILRCVRFSIKLGFTIDKETKLAMYSKMDRLKLLSSERIQSELNQIILHANHKNIMQLHETRVLEYIIPELKVLFDTPQNNPYHIYNVGIHTLKAMVTSMDKLHIRLALLLHDICKPECKMTDENRIDHFYKHGIKGSDKVIEIMRRLKYSNEMIEKVSTLVLYHDVRLEPTKKSIKRWMNKLGVDMLRDLLEVRLGDIYAQNPVYLEERKDKIINILNMIDEIIEEGECFSIKDLDITGKDIIDLGYKQGRIIGYILNYLVDAVIIKPEMNKKSNLIEFLENNKDLFK